MVLSEAQKRKIARFAAQRYKDNDVFHRMKHIRNVVANAAMLVRKEGGDRDVCWAASMLHDIAKHKRGDHGTIGAKEARDFLLGIGVDRATVDRIYDVIHFHNKGFVGGPIERQIVYDADKLDSITLHGFRKRTLRYFKMESASRGLVRRVESEYLLLKKGIHTEEAKRLVNKDEAQIMRIFSKLKAGRHG
jgi:HD superfamily phosphodiesterase